APTKEEDPDFSMYDARYSVIYWRPSTTQNATGGQIVDPRSGEILKGEVNMYHNIMNLLTNWYFIQVGPLDERAQTLPLPDDLMGRLVEYVVTHEIGHSIGMPHNMKASSQYPADSVRSESFLRRMGHVSTLMDYSRMNYVAQPEDNIPPELLLPRIGPYDRFAVRWAYAPIPGAKTPEDELETLNEWAREQDTKPWLRWTTSDSPNDPGALTEAVGDEDAVYSSTLALKNLQRVMDMLVDVTEKEGKDYSQLEELYGQAVSQWGRYMGHVAAVVGGADTQERLGTGPRFKPVSRQRQEEAVQFLAENAFQTPEMFSDVEILSRIEAAGVLQRLRQSQSRVINTLLNKGRMDRLSEYEAFVDDPSSVYTAADLMEDLREAIWSELDDRTVTVDVYRRNLQRAYLEGVERQLNPPAAGEGGGGGRRGGFGQAQQPRWESDQRPVLRGELLELDALCEAAVERAGDAMTRLHLRDIRMEIERILKGDE
ncbi:MAG: zinc-dependent metalloprotease, partial [Longimicrobiales bacterium]